MEGTVGSSAVKLDAAPKDRVKLMVKRKAVQAMLEQCLRAIESLSEEDPLGDGDGEERRGGSSSSGGGDKEADELCDLLRSRVECPGFLEKLETAQMSVSQHIVDECSSWDLVGKNDPLDGDVENPDLDEYVLVGEEDIDEGIACIMAAYHLAIKQRKDLTPDQLQDALNKTFSVKKKKGKLHKAWDGSKVIYNVASWGATAVGIYQNPALVRAATAAFWTSCHVVSKLI
uniref:Uncharacterized protein n=1 Tax=Kalanchoe fedtschenkoi TaxID=63787 RepID=A0A7N0UL41_KALFE